ncbi:hypothetical protein [Streptomyces sp. NPDC093676]|uniref:hypothetical protein n=1 Tax=Streptomyces sp. NPDC093676 TaxID=3366050 RepID=UPI0037F22ABC
MAETVWVVAQVKSFNAEGWALDWDLGGIYTTEDAARSACTQPGDSMWPVQLNQPLPRETVEPPGLEYPAGLIER